MGVTATVLAQGAFTRFLLLRRSSLASYTADVAPTSGESFDERSTFEIEHMEPHGKKPDLGKARPKAAVQEDQEQ